MKNIEDINKAAIQKITANKKITDFSPGDTIKVGVKIVEGKRERIQFFELLLYLYLQCFSFFLFKYFFQRSGLWRRVIASD